MGLLVIILKMSVMTVAFLISHLPSSNILTAFLLLMAGMVMSSVIFALELLSTSNRPPPIPPEITYDRVEFMVPRRPIKQVAMDNRVFIVRAHERSRKPWTMSVSDKRKL